MIWHDRAACRGVSSVNWAGTLTPAAATLCSGCPVRVECLNAALGHESKWDVGVWGGTDPKLRHRIRTGQVTVAAAWAEADAIAAQPVLE